METVAHILDENGLPPEVLSLEITEGLMLENEVGLLGKLGNLRALDLGPKINDFGAGYSSFSYPKQMPVEVLKIDRSFVKDLRENPEALKVVGGIIDLARTLNLCIRAEGIETRDQLEALEALEYELGQDYLFSRPIPAWEIPPLLGAGDKPTTTPAAS